MSEKSVNLEALCVAATKNTEAIVQPVSKFSVKLNSSIEVANYIHTVHSELKSVKSAISTLNSALKVAKLVPPLKNGVRVIQAPVNSLSKQVDKVFKKVDAVEKKIARPRTYMIEVHKQLDTINVHAAEVIKLDHEFIENYHTFYTIIDDEQLRRKYIEDEVFAEECARVLTKLDPLAILEVTHFNEFQIAYLNIINKLSPSISFPSLKIDILSDISETLHKILSIIKPISDVFSPIIGAMDITVWPIPKITVKDVFETMGSLVDKALSLIDFVLKPIEKFIAKFTPSFPDIPHISVLDALSMAEIEKLENNVKAILKPDLDIPKFPGVFSSQAIHNISEIIQRADKNFHILHKK